MGFRSISKDVETHLEDANFEGILAGLRAIEDAGVKHAVSTLGGDITVSQCDDCQRAWLERSTISQLPQWCEQPSGRGRKVEVAEITKVLQEAGWIRTQLFCPSCSLKRVPAFVEAVLTLSNVNMRRFFRVYSINVRSASFYSQFRSTIAYQFHVEFITLLFKKLPAKHRKAFAAMSDIMSTLGLL